MPNSLKKCPLIWQRSKGGDLDPPSLKVGWCLILRALHLHWEKPGALSGVIETQFGYHIIQLQERISTGVRSFDEVKPELLLEARTKFTQTDARVAEAEQYQREGGQRRRLIHFQLDSKRLSDLSVATLPVFFVK